MYALEDLQRRVYRECDNTLSPRPFAINCGAEAACNPSPKFQAWNLGEPSMDLDAINRPASGQPVRLTSALIIPNFDRALHTLIAHLIRARLRD